jgi:hypothetical protein
MERRHRTFEEFWDVTLDLSPGFHDAVLSQPAGEIEEIRASLERRFEPFRATDGTLAIPGLTLVARAEA